MAKRQGIMLAHPAEEKRVRALGPDCFVQPKLNGVRCRIESPTNPFKLVSSSGKEKKFFGHIQEELAHLPTLLWDGELYIHGKSWEHINSICSRTVNPHPESGTMEFHIFDFIEQGRNQWQRASILSTVRSLIDRMELRYVKVVSTFDIKTASWGGYLNEYMEAGYEGIILRGYKGIYKDHRSPNLLKFKPRKTDIYRITRLIQGEGWCLDRLGAFEVEDKNGNLFNVGTGPCLTAGGRLGLWEDRHELVGKYLLVKHEELKTINDLPKCVVAVKPLTEAELEVYLRDKHEDLQWEGE